MSAQFMRRNIRISVRLTEEEHRLLKKKMARIGVTNQEAFLRKMALDGLVIKLDLPELKQMISLLRYTSNNINQIAKRLNESGRAYETCSHMQVVLIQPVCVRHHAGYKRGVDCFLQRSFLPCRQHTEYHSCSSFKQCYKY